MALASALFFDLIDSNVSYPTIFLNAFNVTLLTLSREYVGETFNVNSLFSSIGTAKSFDYYSRIWLSTKCDLLLAKVSNAYSRSAFALVLLPAI